MALYHPANRLSRRLRAHERAAGHEQDPRVPSQGRPARHGQPHRGCNCSRRGRRDERPHREPQRSGRPPPVCSEAEPEDEGDPTERDVSHGVELLQRQSIHKVDDARTEEQAEEQVLSARRETEAVNAPISCEEAPHVGQQQQAHEEEKRIHGPPLAAEGRPSGMPASRSWTAMLDSRSPRAVADADSTVTR